MRHNKNVSPSRANNVPSQGNAQPLANLPANNNGTFKVKLGAGQDSKFGHGVGPGKGAQSVTQSKGSKANMPSSNNNTKAPKMGNTKHGVGEVPAYLRNS